MVGPKTMESHIAGTMNAAATAAGRPEPRIIGGFPVVLTTNVEAVRDALADAVRDWRDDLAKATQQAIDQGHLRADTDPELFAFQLHSLMVGYKLDSGLVDEPDAAIERVRAGFEFLVRACSP